MKPSTRSERPQSLSRRSGSIAGSRSRIASAGRRSGSRSLERSASASSTTVLGGLGQGCPLGVPRAVHSIQAPMRSKDQVRRAVWQAMDREGVSRFPGAEGRIPNFAGAKLAAGEARRPPDLEARPGDQGEPRLAADPRPPARARGGQDDRDGGAAAARPAPVPAARPAPAERRADPRGGDDQGRAAPRPGGRRRRAARHRPRRSAARSRSTSTAPGSARAAASPTSSTAC